MDRRPFCGRRYGREIAKYSKLINSTLNDGRLLRMMRRLHSNGQRNVTMLILNLTN